MKFLQYIWIMALAAFTSLLLYGCASDPFLENGEGDEPDAEHAVMAFRILTSDGGDDGDETGVKELIKSLRILMIDESGLIECNEYFQADELKTNYASGEIYYFYRVTTPGKKKFYLFANEESVSAVSGITGFNNKPFTTFLSNYPEGSYSSSDFETKITAAYTAPSFSIEDGVVYLPYSSFYELDMKAGKRYEQPMYLVPVATKFYFNFINNRTAAVHVQKLGISQCPKNNYIMGHVEDSQQELAIEGKKYYWVDWLAKISEMSQSSLSFEENETFNEKYGWITDYTMPPQGSAGYSDYPFIEKSSDGNSSEDNVIKARTDNGGGNLPTPGRKSFGPYYLPESKYIPNNKDKKQVYTLILELEDQNPSVDEVVIDDENLVLTNLASLFRDTHVVVNITMDEGTDKIYVEIRSWFSTENFFGTAIKNNN